MESIGQSLATPVEELVLETALLAGKMLMRSGAETARVESTMNYILSTALKDSDNADFDTYVLLNGIFVRIGTFKTSFLQVPARKNDVGEVAEVNQISRDYSTGRIPLDEAHRRLTSVEKKPTHTLDFTHIASSFFLSGFVIFLFGGTGTDILPSAIAGLISYFIYHLVDRYLEMPFVTEFFSSLLGGLVGYLMSTLFQANFDMVTIGVVIPLVPGISMANAMRDLMDRHYYTGIIRFIECLLIAAALGGGTATIYFLFGR